MKNISLLFFLLCLPVLYGSEIQQRLSLTDRVKNGVKKIAHFVKKDENLLMINASLDLFCQVSLIMYNLNNNAEMISAFNASLCNIQMLLQKKLNKKEKTT